MFFFFVGNIAGKNQVLDNPNGQDILGLNLPFKEFQAGTFETTYLDENMRISRGKVGAVEQLRVFVRNGEGNNNNMMKAETEDIEDDFDTNDKTDIEDEIDEFEVEVDPGFET